MTNVVVVLLRTPSQSSSDPYDSIFRNASYNPYSIPVLQTSFSDLSKLQDLIAAGPHPRPYAGVIITSKRSCEAWITAVKSSVASSDNQIARTQLKFSLATWTNTPFYVVGKATAAALEEFQTICLNLGVDPFALDIRGEGSGSGEQLAHFILQDLGHGGPDGTKWLLYLTGDRNRDTVPKILSPNKEAHIQLDTIQVYETHSASDFEDNLNSIIQENLPDTRDWWIVFFAPSSSAFACPFLRKYFRFRGREPELGQSRPSDTTVAHVAAIGRTTSSFLEGELDIYVDAVAEKPTPDALLVAITANSS